MKKVLLSLAFVAVLATVSCKKAEEAAPEAPAVDTTAVAVDTTAAAVDTTVAAPVEAAPVAPAAK
jgi:PBP1b-binding outer membrane lipoprotein LpoB